MNQLRVDVNGVCGAERAADWGLWRRSSLSLDRLRMTCEFEAPDAESVREALRTAGVPYERVWTANVYAIEHYPELMEKLRVLEAKAAGRGG